MTPTKAPLGLFLLISFGIVGRIASPAHPAGGFAWFGRYRSYSTDKTAEGEEKFFVGKNLF
jgi:hypothetical protein